MARLTEHIRGKTSIAPLVTFRALFGLIMLISIARFAANGWIEQLYIDPDYVFSYAGFEWVRPLGKAGMYMLFALMALGATGIMLGWRYRITSVVFFATFTYVELIDKTNYLNHYYFVSIIAFLLILVPAHRNFSLDAKRRPEIAISTVPSWMVNIFKIQLGLVYFFAGMAKITPDWLLKAMPLKIWLAGKSHIPVIGWLFNYTWTAYVFSWAGMLYDLCVPFLLLSRRWRPFAYAAVIVFHLLTALLFKIGMFPFIMILSTLIFFPASFHDTLILKFNSLFTGIFSQPALARHRQSPAPLIPASVITVVLIIHFSIQIALPLRYTLFPGNLFWTEQGYRFSWRVMLMEKAGTAQFIVKGKDGKMEYVDNSDFLTPYQEKMMSTQPDMILQFAQHLAEEYRKRGFEEPKVSVDAQVTLNGRRSTALINPAVNLATVDYEPGSNFWITKGPQ